MLTDPKEIEIISKARQPNVRDPERSRVHFDQIFDAFFKDQGFSGRTFLDLGPGQFDFGELVRESGGQTVAIDNDPAVVELGRYKGFETHEGNIRHLSEMDLGHLFDGIFCKFSISALWFRTEEEHQQLVNTLSALLKPKGWIWIAPWNGTRPDTEFEDHQLLSWQISAFASVGAETWELSPYASKLFGVHGRVANRALFTLGLPVPKDPKLLRALSADMPRGSDDEWPDPKKPEEKPDEQPAVAEEPVSKPPKQKPGLIEKFRSFFSRSRD